MPDTCYDNRILTAAPKQDVIFGSEGTAQADFERMEEINNEIGLTAMLRGGSGAPGSDVMVSAHEKEKLGDQEHNETAL